MRKGALFAAATLLAAVAVAVAVVSARPTPPDRASAVRFISGIVRATVANRYDETWASLDPVQQALVSRDAYVHCESRSPIPGSLRSLRVLATSPAKVRVPEHGTLPGWAVRLRVVIVDPAFPPAVVVHTFHAIRVGGDWHWYLPAARLALYGRACGSRPLPAV